MVFIHGGGYLIHSAANYGDWNICRNLCLRDVIVCVIQYRLGMLGFLSTGDRRCPGNFGLWDQLAAFRWIRTNIAAFHGNPENITAFGQSAGAASLDFLSISPKNESKHVYNIYLFNECFKDLFKRVILMGGNACGDWAFSNPSKTLRAALKMAKKLKFDGRFCLLKLNATLCI